jgi:signal transduction histidine kinase
VTNRAAAARAATGALLAALGVGTLMLVLRDPYQAAGGGSPVGVSELLLPGWAVAASGLATWRRRPASRAGILLVAAGAAWFAVEWTNPGGGWAPLFTAGLVVFAICPVLVAHAALAFPAGRLRSRIDRALLAIGYAGALLVLGLVPALWFDPAAQGCSQCPDNLLAVADSARLVDTVTGLGLGLGLGWSLALALLVLRDLATVSPALRRPKMLVSLAAVAFLGVTAWRYLDSLPLGTVGSGTATHRRWVAQGAALLVLAAGVGWAGTSLRRTRSRVARLVIELALSPAPGGLREALAVTLRDPSLQVGYPLADGRLVDVHGHILMQAGSSTQLVRGSRLVAVLAHRPGLLDDPSVVDEVTGAARLVLDNERLQAEFSAQLEHLRASRERIVASADRERRRLERDLHDGAQQRLVTVLLDVRLARLRFARLQDACALAECDAVENELTAAVEELRAVAHGVFPAVLADEGFGPAVEAWAEAASVPVQVVRLDEGPPHQAADSAAYFVLAESVRRSGATAATVSVHRDLRRLCLDVCLDGGQPGGAWLVDLEDRAGAVDGRVRLQHLAADRVRIRAEFPCAS